MDLTYKLTDWILFDFRRDNDLQFSRLNMEFAIYLPKDGPIATKPKSKHIISIELNDQRVWLLPWPWKVRCKDLLDSDRGDFKCRRVIYSSSL